MAAVGSIVADSGSSPMKSGQVVVGVVLVSAACNLERACMYLEKGITKVLLFRCWANKGLLPTSMREVLPKVRVSSSITQYKEVAVLLILRKATSRRLQVCAGLCACLEHTEGPGNLGIYGSLYPHCLHFELSPLVDSGTNSWSILLSGLAVFSNC